MSKCKPILLVENNDKDIKEIELVIHSLDTGKDLIVKKNSNEALEYLQRPNNIKPSVILLDLNIPRMDAFALLKAIKNSDSLNAIPVIALTASEIGRDVIKHQKLNIDEYMVKPIDGKQLLECLRNLKIYET